MRESVCVCVREREREKERERDFVGQRSILPGSHWMFVINH